MTWLSTMFISMFASNALLTWGFGFRQGLKSDIRRTPSWFVVLLALNLVASIILWFLSSLVLRPLGMSYLVALAYALFVIPAVRLLSRGAFLLSGREAQSLELDELTSSTLVFGISLIAIRGSTSLTESLLAAFSSVFGWWSAIEILGAVNRRTEEGSVPPRMKGAPVMLISAGLLAMTVSLARIALGQGLGK
ncbi:MAG TPA: hypothetical protein VMV83_07065 [Rectinemataceae bacterium]|nr:hypothetical protein [Rectinemataceae bacterium]